MAEKENNPVVSKTVAVDGHSAIVVIFGEA